MSERYRHHPLVVRIGPLSPCHEFFFFPFLFIFIIRLGITFVLPFSVHFSAFGGWVRICLIENYETQRLLLLLNQI